MGLNWDTYRPKYMHISPTNIWFNLYYQSAPKSVNFGNNQQASRIGGQIAQSLSRRTIKLFSKRHLACPCGQLQISLELGGVGFGAGASFLVRTLSVHGDFKLSSLWRVTVVFQEFLVHGRLVQLLAPWLFLNILTNFLSSEGNTLGLLQTLANRWYIRITWTYIQLFEVVMLKS